MRITNEEATCCRAGWLLTGITFAAVTCLSVSGCARAYHDLHYNHIVAEMAKEHASTFHHSARTGRIIPKRHGEACVCEPACFGYEPTCWNQWPVECPSCPTSGEMLVEVAPDDVGRADAEGVSEPLLEEGPSGAIAPDPDRIPLRVGRRLLPRSLSATPLDIVPTPELEGPDMDMSVPTSTDRSESPPGSLLPTDVVDPQPGDELLDWFDDTTMLWNNEEFPRMPMVTLADAPQPGDYFPASVVQVVLRQSKKDDRLGLQPSGASTALYQQAQADATSSRKPAAGRVQRPAELADPSPPAGRHTRPPALGAATTASPMPRPVFKISAVPPPLVGGSPRALAAGQRPLPARGDTTDAAVAAEDEPLLPDVRFRSLRRETIRVGDEGADESVIRFRR